MSLAWTELVLRICAAGLLGALIGLDREHRHKPLGFRTLSVVALASAMLTVAAIQHDADLNADVETVSRTIQGVLAGIGFLGGGVILRTQGRHIRGLTTAALVWLTAALGIACGLGAWLPALVVVVFTLAVLWIGLPLEATIRKRRTGKSTGTTDG